MSQQQGFGSSGGGGSSPLTTKGDLYTYTTTNARLPIGANTYILTADSSQATGLIWSAPVTPVWTLIQSQTASNQASVDFTTGITSAYKEFKLIITGLRCVVAGGEYIKFLCSTNGGSSYDTGANYSWNNQYYGSNSAQDWDRASSSAYLKWATALPNSGTATDTGSAEILISGLASSTQYKQFRCIATTNIGVDVYITNSGGSYNSATAVNAFRIIQSAGNIFAGTFTLYGIS